MNDFSNIQSKFNEFLLNNQQNEALELINNYFQNHSKDKTALMFCKDSYSKLGKAEQIINCYNLLIKEDLRNADYYYERALIFHDIGKFDSFEKSILTAISLDPKKLNFFLSLSAYYKRRRQFFDMMTIMKTAYKNIPTEECKKELDLALTLLKDDSIDNSAYFKEEEKKKRESQLFSDQTIIDMLNLFSGRENVYARQWKDDEGKSGYVPVREPLNFYEMKNHLLGKNTLGVYQLDLSNQVKFMALDLDVAKFAQKQYLENSRFKDFVNQGFFEICNQIRCIIDRFEIPVYIENSGFKGFHLWFFLKEKISAKIAFLFLNKVKAQVDVGKFPIQIECFPKQSKLNPDQLGNLIKIPLGIHLKTGNRCWFIDEKHKAIENYEIISNFKHSSLNQIIEALNQWKNIDVGDKSEIEKTKVNDNETEEDFRLPVIEKKVSLDSHPEYQWILSKCYVIRQIIAKIETNFEISNQERLTLSYTLGHLSNGAEIVNLLLNKCINIPEEAYLKSNFSGNPVSCPKIRARLMTLADREKCNCRFSDLLNSYPNPLLHLQELNHHNVPVNQIDSVKLKRLIENYLNTKKEFNELKRSIESQEKMIIDYMDHAGISEVDTSFGKLIIVNSDNKNQLRLEL